jgi:hypothetical protein
MERKAAMKRKVYRPWDDWYTVLSDRLEEEEALAKKSKAERAEAKAMVRAMAEAGAWEEEDAGEELLATLCMAGDITSQYGQLLRSNQFRRAWGNDALSIHVRLTIADMFATVAVISSAKYRLLRLRLLPRRHSAALLILRFMASAPLPHAPVVSLLHRLLL